MKGLQLLLQTYGSHRTSVILQGSTYALTRQAYRHTNDDRLQSGLIDKNGPLNCRGHFSGQVRAATSTCAGAKEVVI